MMQGIQQHDLAEPTSMLRLVEVDPRADPRWEALLASLPNGSIYYHPAWLELLEEAYGGKPIYLACEDAQGQLQGILPLVYMRRLLIGRRFISLPRTPMAGPLARDAQTMAFLVRAAVERVRSEPGTRLELKVLSNALDGLVEGVVGVPWLETYLLELPEQSDLLRFGNSRNHARIKWAVNKAARSGIQVRAAETERDLRAWYQLHLDTMRRRALLPWPYYFFQIAWERLRPSGLMRLLLAEQSQAGRTRLLAGSFFLLFGQMVSYAFTGWRREDLSLRANDAIHWGAIHDACADGFRLYDFGGVSKDNQGLAEFKAKWGAQPAWLYRYHYPAPISGETGSGALQSSAYQLAHVAFGRLPVKATALLSNWVHRAF